MERCWLVTVLKDSRIRLFLPEDDLKIPELPDSPLWSDSDIVYFDGHHRGEPFSDWEYVRNFRCFLSVIREKKQLSLRYISQEGKMLSYIGTAIRVEYSQKDDKFRFLLLHQKEIKILNAANIRKVHLMDLPAESCMPAISKRQVTVKIQDKRNALNQTMLHFSDLEKITCALDENTYQMTIYYYPEDEAEILIRLLSFGPFIQVLSPQSMIDKIKERLLRQRQWSN